MTFRIKAPGRQGDGQVVGIGVGAAVIEIDHAGDLIALEQHIVRKEVGVDRPVRQVARRPTQTLQRRLHPVQQPPILSGGCDRATLGQSQPGGRPQWVGPLLGKVRALQMQSRQGRARRRLGLEAGGPQPVARLPFHQGGVTAIQPPQPAARPIHHRRRGRKTPRRQMRRQPQAEGQHVRIGPLLEQRQDQTFFVGLHPVVGVLDALGNGFERLQLAEIIGAQKKARVGLGHRRENGHVALSF